MVYQEDLREGAVRAIWVGDLRHEDALVTYLDEAFQQDFGFLLEDDGDPEFTYSFDSRRKPPDLKNPNRIRTCCVPFDQEVDVRKLMERFSHAGGWIEDAVRQADAKGIKAATVAVAFDNLSYRPELCRNADAPLRFVGNIAWPEGRELWQESQRKRVVRPPFPTLIRREYGEESKFFDWSGVVHLDPWSGFATPAEVSPKGYVPSRGWLLDGDLRLKVEPASPAASRPTDDQAATFQFLLDHQQAIQHTVLQAIFDLYPNWRNRFYGSNMSGDGGQTWQSGWKLPGQFPPDLMPEIGRPEDLRRLIRPQTIHVMAKPKNDQTRLGISFSCRWDEEHGLGVSMHMGRVIGVGGADVAFEESAEP